MKIALRACVDCQADISDRQHNAKRCLPCADKLAQVRERTRSATRSKTVADRAYRHHYYRTPEYKAKSKKRYIRNLEHRKQYNQRPEVVARRRARQQSPEGKEAQARATRKYLLKKAEEKTC